MQESTVMEVSVHCETLTLQIICPHCGQREDDPYEVLATGRLESLRCASCHCTFHVALMECLACADEWQFGWREPPSPSRFKQLACAHCGKKYQDYEESALSHDFFL